MFSELKDTELLEAIAANHHQFLAGYKSMREHLTIKLEEGFLSRQTVSDGIALATEYERRSKGKGDTDDS